MTERDIAASSGRLERALAALLRQELSAPVVTMQGFLDIIAADAKRFRLHDAIADLDRMRIASAELAQLINRLIDEPDIMRREHEDFDSFQSRLRHDLRTPLNAIKGYSELLAEDMTDGTNKALIPDLEKVHTLADELLAQIDDDGRARPRTGRWAARQGGPTGPDRDRSAAHRRRRQRSPMKRPGAGLRAGFLSSTI